MATVLMPKATAVWLIENTALSFEQIAAFCGLHHLEVQGIANEEVAKGIRGIDPIAGGVLAREEIARGEANGAYRLKALDQNRIELPERKRKGARFVPVARRGDRPDAIAWFVRNHAEVSDAQIVKLIGTTKATIEQVRGRTHWNISQIKPVDPVSLGLCSQIELDAVVAKAAETRARQNKRLGIEDGPGLRPAQETTRIVDDHADFEDAPHADEDDDHDDA
ncbi:MAG: DUF1013 domain-containing protein [Caulobacterales bacterium]|jgi:hypothetical protein